VIAGRVDPPLPLARLRARGQLAEIRAAELRVTPDEAGAYFREVMGRALTAVPVAALEERTEDWVAGLQLAALARQGTTDIPGFIAAFAGSHRDIVDDLADEVRASTASWECRRGPRPSPAWRAWRSPRPAAW
jgi:LuxR family maltose regulon positive regulatory protein